MFTLSISFHFTLPLRLLIRMVMNSLILFFWGENKSSTFVKDALLDAPICQCFLFFPSYNILTISSHSLLACKVSIEKSILSGKPFMCQITFSCFFQNSLFVFKSWQFHYNVSWSISSTYLGTFHHHESGCSFLSLSLKYF